MLATATERAGLSPLERVLAIFDALEEPLRAPSFRGCPFVKGLAEFGPEANSPNVQATIAMYFKRLPDLVASPITPLALSMPEKALAQILFLVHGCIVIAQSQPPPHLLQATPDTTTNRD